MPPQSRPLSARMTRMLPNSGVQYRSSLEAANTSRPMASSDPLLRFIIKQPGAPDADSIFYQDDFNTSSRNKDYWPLTIVTSFPIYGDLVTKLVQSIEVARSYDVHYLGGRPEGTEPSDRIIHPWALKVPLMQFRTTALRQFEVVDQTPNPRKLEADLNRVKEFFRYGVLKLRRDQVFIIRILIDDQTLARGSGPFGVAMTRFTELTKTERYDRKIVLVFRDAARYLYLAEMVRMCAGAATSGIDFDEASPEELRRMGPKDEYLERKLKLFSYLRDAKMSEEVKKLMSGRNWDGEYAMLRAMEISVERGTKRLRDA